MPELPGPRLDVDLPGKPERAGRCGLHTLRGKRKVAGDGAGSVGRGHMKRFL